MMLTNDFRIIHPPLDSTWIRIYLSIFLNALFGVLNFCSAHRFYKILLMMTGTGSEPKIIVESHSNEDILIIMASVAAGLAGCFCLISLIAEYILFYLRGNWFHENEINPIYVPARRLFKRIWIKSYIIFVIFCLIKWMYTWIQIYLMDHTHSMMTNNGIFGSTDGTIGNFTIGNNNEGEISLINSTSLVRPKKSATIDFDIDLNNAEAYEIGQTFVYVALRLCLVVSMFNSKNEEDYAIQYAQASSSRTSSAGP